MPDRPGPLPAGETAPDGVAPLAERSRTLGYPTLLAVTYATVAGCLYLLLGPIAASALGATPIVMLAAAVLFALAVMTYVEGASIHPERGGSPTFARHGLDELWSFATAWSLLLDSILLTAAATLAATNYLEAAWPAVARGWVELAVAVLLLTVVTRRAIRGGIGGVSFPVRRLLVGVDVVLQASVVVLGLVLLSNPSVLTDTISWSSTGDWQGVLFALGATMLIVTGLESAAALAGDVPIGRRDLRRLVRTLPLLMVLLYGGVATVGLMALPVIDGTTALGERWIDAPILGIVDQLGTSSAIDVLTIVVGLIAAATLTGMVLASLGSAGRITVQLALHRQLPTRLGRLHPEHGTPRLVLIVVAVIAAGLVALRDMEFLVGTMAFGVLFATTVAHVAVIRLRYVEPDAPRPFRIPGNVRFRGGLLPIPAVAGAVLSAAVWVSVVISHPAARVVGISWLVVGTLGYVLYRRYHELPVRGRITVPEQALRGEEAAPQQFRSILVPLLGSGLDDDLVQTAGRLAGGEDDDDPERGFAVIEAVWIHVVPMAVAIDGPIADVRMAQARTALARARAVGEEYDGVRVATSAVRARAVGSAIVQEARRRGCEAIVMVAPPPLVGGRRRAGGTLGARGGGFVLGDAARYVITHAPCQVILTAPALDETDAVIRRRREAEAELRRADDELSDEDEQWLLQL